MGIGQFQFGGLASGLDTNAIVSAILDLEARPIRQLETQKRTEQQRLDLLGTFENLVKALREKADEFSDSGEFLSNSLSIGTEGVATFSVNSDAAAGSHELEVVSLAQADRYAFEGVDSLTDGVGAGTISFTYDGVNYDVDVADVDTIEEVAAAIESETDGAVQASVINVGTDESPSYRLVLAGTDTGEDFAISSLTTDVTSLGAAESLTSASNAVVLIDNLTIERSTNVMYFDD